MVEINAKAPKVNKSYAGLYEFGEDLASASELFGVDVIYKSFVAEAKIALQAIIRNALGAGKSNDEIDSIVASWKPGETRERMAQDPLAAALAKVAKLDEAGRRAFLEKLAAIVQAPPTT